MSDPFFIAAVTVTFVVAGCIKGVIGLGLPTVSLALLTATVGLQPAMALLLAPSLVTNFWQAAVGGHGRAILARTWPFLLAAIAAIWIGSQALRLVDIALLSALLGALLVIYAAVGLTRPTIEIPKRWEVWAGPLAGAANGVLTGMTGSFVMPGVIYLQAIGLPRDMLIQAMGILFAISTIGLALALGEQRLLTAELATLSLAAIVPALAGMALGQRLRGRIAERHFRQILLTALAALGLFILGKSLN